MHPVSQIIERNLPRLAAGGKALWINPERDGCWQLAAGRTDSLQLSCQDHGAARYLQASGADVSFEAYPGKHSKAYDRVILNLPRQKALLAMLLDNAAATLSGEGALWLAGENRAGIKSARRYLEARFGKVRKLDSARHCTLFEAGNVLAERVFDPLDYREEWPLACGTTDIAVVSYPGVFAHGRLDAGTALLLEVLQDMRIRGEVLDFACGAGVVGACVASRSRAAHVTLLDNNALALKSATETLAANGLDGAVLASDGLSEVEGIFDLIISNPPIHAGLRTDTGLSMRLLDSVLEHLRDKGRLLMVSNIHLPYEKWLAQRFRRTRQVAENRQFKVLLAEK
ncbi:MAG: class I SAM-dependent methyltransferase [Lysobacterales bacterium]